MTIILLFLIGVFAGILAGLLGVGGGLIFTPVLFYLFTQGGLDQPTQWAIGSSLFCTFIASSSSVFKQYRNHNFFLFESLKVGGFGVIGTVIGTTVTTSGWYGAEQFSILFSALLLYAAWNLLYRKRKPKTATPAETGSHKLTWLVALGIGVLGGMVASLAGVGGGIVLVPLMTLLLKLPFPMAVSISSGAIVVISTSAWLQMACANPVNEGITPLTLGFIDFGTALPLIAGSFAGGYLGVKIGHRIHTRLLEQIFAILLLFMALRLIYDSFL